MIEKIEDSKRRTVYSSLPMQMFMSHAIKAPLLKIAALIASKLPEPTKENTWHPNSHRLIEVRDWFFEHCLIGGDKEKFIRIAFNFVIILYDFDPPWRDMMDSAREEFMKKTWLPRGSQSTFPPNWNWWKE